MPKKLQRKPPRKAPARKPKLDEDLAELAALLDEARADRNAAGWFVPPWRNGWNAIELALAATMRAPSGGQRDADAEAVFDLATWLQAKTPSADMYWRAAEHLQATTLTIKPLRAALRCVQVLIAHSDAGGMAYNDILRPAFEAGYATELESMVMRWRCSDALGPMPSPRLERAFEIAWKRGLYRAAYALSPSGKP